MVYFYKPRDYARLLLINWRIIMYKYIKVFYPDGEVEYWSSLDAKEVLRLQKIHNNNVKFKFI